MALNTRDTEMLQYVKALNLPSPRRPGFEISPVHVWFVTDKMSLRQIILRVLQFPPFSIIQQMPHTQNSHRRPLNKETQNTNPSKRQYMLF
jgi:hypothetical protein